MKNMSKILVLTLVGTLALGTVSAFAVAKENSYKKQSDTESSATKKENSNNESIFYLNPVKDKTGISVNEAKKIAIDNSKNGIIKEVKFKEKHGKKVYEIEVLESGIEKEFKIDAKSGEIINIDIEEDDDYYDEDDEHINSKKVKTKITLNEAVSIIEKESPKSIIKETELDKENGKYIFKIETYEGNMEKKYKIDAETGKIINIEIEKDNDNDIKSSKENIKLSLEDAEKIVLKEIPKGNIIDSELKIKNGKAVYDIEISDNSLKKEFKIDANTGQIISSEIDD